MDLFTFPPLAAALDAATRGLTWVADTVEPFAGTGSAAVAIVLVTLLVRAVLIPTGVAQARAEQTRARLAPRLRAIQKRHRNDPERLRRETMRLYAEEQASPFGGCASMLIQAPVVGLVYAVFLHPSIAGHANALLTAQLAGVPLGASLVGMVTTGSVTVSAVALFCGVVLAAVIVGEVTRRRFGQVEAAATVPVTPQRILGLLHFSTAVIATMVPLAAAIYLVVTATWTLGQRVVLRRLYPLQ